MSQGVEVPASSCILLLGIAMQPLVSPSFPESIASHRESIEFLCRKYHVAHLALFGSTLRGEAKEGSDLDLLVSFLPGRTPGLGFFMLQGELQDLLGHPVDLNTPEDLSHYFRAQVQREAMVVYEG